MTDSDGHGRTSEQAWTDILATYEPPHPDANWFAPMFWPLLQAAHAEPVLRRLYPGQSMMYLGFFDHDRWWELLPGHLDSAPLIATWSTGMYTVAAAARAPTSTELLATNNPTEAARYVARLLDIGAWDRGAEP
jgi:hypothetical protein